MPFTSIYNITPEFLEAHQGQGLSIQELADLVGCSYPTMWRACRQYQQQASQKNLGACEFYTPKSRWSELELQVLRDLLHIAGGGLLSKAINRSSSYLWRKAQALKIPNTASGSDQRVFTPTQFWGELWPNYLTRQLPLWVGNNTVQQAFKFLVWPAKAVEETDDPGLNPNPSPNPCNHCNYRRYCQTSKDGLVACENIFLGNLWSAHQGCVGDIKASILQLAEYYTQLSYAATQTQSQSQERSMRT